MSSTLYPIARSFLQALNTFDFDAMAAQLHPSFQHNIWPTIMKFDEDCEAKQAQESGRKALTQKEIFVKQAKELREKVVEKWGVSRDNGGGTRQASGKRQQRCADTLSGFIFA